MGSIVGVFFRAGELMSPAEESFDAESTLTFADIAVDSVHTPSAIQIHLKASKTDPFRVGVNVYVGSTNTELCPVRVMTDYLGQRGGMDGPLFRFKNGKYLTRTTFVTKVREALTVAGVDAGKYAGHSFRRGAATTAQQRGIGDATIKMLGRWKSDAYTRYIKTPRAQLSALTQVLATDPDS